MNSKMPAVHSDAGIAGLPRPRAVVVQLVSTFGLAVFLVLYYVLVMHPAENKRYDELRTSVEALIAVVEKQQSLLTRTQASQLEELFAEAVATSLAAAIAVALEQNTNAVELARRLDDIMLLRVDLLHGLIRKDGGVLSEQPTHKLRNSEIAQQIAEKAVENWRGLTLVEISENCEDTIRFAIRGGARGK